MSRSSNSDSCSVPALDAAPQMAGARSAVIQSSPAGARSSSMRACVIMPRSPTSTTCASPKRSLSLAIWAAERHRVGGIALEHLDGDRAAVGRAQQAVDDLQLASLAVAIVAEPGELAAAALHDSSRTRRRAPACRRAGAAWRAPLRPRPGAPASQSSARVELVLVDRAQARDAPRLEAAVSGREGLGGGELGGRLGEARDDHGDDEIAAAVAVRVRGCGRARSGAACRARRRRDRAAATRLMVSASWAAGAEMTVPPLSRALQALERDWAASR